MFLCQAPQQPKQLPVVDGPTVHIGDHRPFSGDTHPLSGRCGGQIRRSGPFQNQSDIRLHRKSCAKSATGPYLLLDGKDKGAVHGKVLLHQLYHDGAADPVVDGLGLEEAVPEGQHVGVEDCHITGTHPGFGVFGVLRTDVDVKLFQLRDLFLLVRAGQVQPLAAQYCSGSGVTCAGLSQWGTVSLANQGYSVLSILRYYFGQDVSLVYNAPTAPNIPSYSGVPLQVGSAGAQVRTVQRELNRISANYPAIPRIGSVSGVFDAATRNAVIVFQQIFGLAVDGVVGKQTWYKLKYIYNGVKNLSEIYSEGLTISEVERVFSNVLRQGDRGIAVRTIQYYLNFIGQFNDSLTIGIAEDGIFGQETKRAVEAFQRYYGLTVDGIVGRNTWNAVIDAYNDILRSLPSDFTGFSSLLYPGYYITRGASGRIVEQLQTFLRVIARNNNAIPNVAVDGIFGPQTQAAVIAVQNWFDLEPDGVVGPITWNAIITLYNEYR